MFNLKKKIRNASCNLERKSIFGQFSIHFSQNLHFNYEYSILLGENWIEKISLNVINNSNFYK